MARVQFVIEDPVNRLTLKAVLKAAGHRIVGQESDVVITDDMGKAAEFAKASPTLVLANASQIRDAVAAMRQGVCGYLFLPFQPGEAPLMVERALKEYRPKPESSSNLMTLEEAEARHILAMLRHCKNNRAKAARMLGIGRNTLWRKLKKLQRLDFSG